MNRPDWIPEDLWAKLEIARGDTPMIDYLLQALENMYRSQHYYDTGLDCEHEL